MTGTPSGTFASANWRVGSSRWSPFRNTTSASAITAASEGAGSNVWLFVPSGTIPVTQTWSPPMFCTLFVIGDTVVTALSAHESLAESAPVAVQADAVNARARHTRNARRNGYPRTRWLTGAMLPSYCNMLQLRPLAEPQSE